MSKLIYVATLLVAVVTTVTASPAQKFERLESVQVNGLVGQDFHEEEHLRFRRVTCDLFGFTGNSACAANCLSMGKAGGTCHGGICVCRTDKIKDLLDKRFPVPEGFNPVEPQRDLVKEFFDRRQ